MTARPKPLTRRIGYALETVLVYTIYGFFKLLPLDTASSLGGWIGRTLGPLLPAHATAHKNILMAFPEKDDLARQEIILGMWDNLGRTAAEYAHLHHIWSRIKVTGAEHLVAAKESGKSSIFFGGHFANWEVPAIAAKTAGLDVHLIYRQPNNPGVDKLLRYARESGASGHIKKGAAGAREMISVLKQNGTLGIMMDQKLNEGISIPFFGRDAMTAPAIALFALKFKCPVFPIQIERLNGAKFHLTIFPPLEMPNGDDQDQNTHAILTNINSLIEKWVRAHPEQWLWIHRRWPD